MNHGFVPLSLSLRASPPGRANAGKAAAQPQGGAPFRPLAALSSSPCAAPEPTLTLERDGDRVTRITIQCPCGHVIELACEPDAEGSDLSEGR